MWGLNESESLPATKCLCKVCYCGCDSGLLVQTYEREEGHKTCSRCRDGIHEKKFEIKTKACGGHIDPITNKYTRDKTIGIWYKQHSFQITLWRGKLPQKENSRFGITRSRGIVYFWIKKWTLYIGYSKLWWRDKEF